MLWLAHYLFSCISPEPPTLGLTDPVITTGLGSFFWPVECIVQILGTNGLVVVVVVVVVVVECIVQFLNSNVTLCLPREDMRESRHVTNEYISRVCLPDYLTRLNLENLSMHPSTITSHKTTDAAKAWQKHIFGAS